MTKFRVVHIPQVGHGISYVKEVKTLEEGKLLMDTLAEYDQFQFENNIKPDYSNATFFEYYNEEDKEWQTWYDEESGLEIEEYFEELKESDATNN